jgi:hypothetical protein
MGKLIGLMLIVLGVWIGIEIYDKGVDQAFGGLFAWFEAPLHTDEGTEYDSSTHGAEAPTRREVHRGSLAQRVGAKVQSDIDAGARRDGAGDEEDND